MTKKTVLALFAVLVLLWAGNLIYFQKQQLPKPLFLKHYYAFSVGGDSSLEFQINYLVNRSKDIELVGLEIAGKDVRLQVRKGGASTFTHYYLKTDMVIINGQELDKLLSSEDAAISKLEAYFSDGSRQDVKIGEIYLVDERMTADSPLQVRVNGSSNQNQGFTLFYANAPLVVKSLENHFQDRLGASYKVYLDRSQTEINGPGFNDSQTYRNGQRFSDPRDEHETIAKFSTQAGQEVTKDMFPFTVESGETFRLSYSFAFDRGNPAKAYDYYQIEGKVTSESNGRTFAERYFIHYDPHFNDAALRAMIRERRET